MLLTSGFFDYNEVLDLLKYWKTKLRVGGTLDLQFLILKICELYQKVRV